MKEITAGISIRRRVYPATTALGNVMLLLVVLAKLTKIKLSRRPSALHGTAAKIKNRLSGWDSQCGLRAGGHYFAESEITVLDN